MRTFSGSMVVNGQLKSGVLIFSSILALVRKIHLELPLLVLSGTFSLCYSWLLCSVGISVVDAHVRLCPFITERGISSCLHSPLLLPSQDRAVLAK